MSDGLARGLNGQLAGAHGQVPRVGRGLRQAGRRHVGRRRSPRAARISPRRCARSPTDGPDAFYKGWIADRIAEDMAANGGLITKADLAAYEAKERAPVKGTFRGYEIVVDAAAQLRRRRADRDAQHARALRPQGQGLLTSPDAMHLEIEAMRRAYLDRARYLGDPDFVQVPLSQS